MSTVAPKYTTSGFESGFDFDVDMSKKSLDVAWLFSVNGGAYHWSTQAITVDGQAYAAAVDPDSFDRVRIAGSYNGAERIHVVEDIGITIPDPDGNYASADFLGYSVDISLWISDGTYSRVIRKFLMQVKSAKRIYDVLHLTLQDRFAAQDLEAMYPATEQVQNVWASDGDSALGYCFPVPFGIAFIPLPSVYITDQRYYVLGEDVASYNIYKVRSPDSWPKSEWPEGATYPMNLTTAGDYKVFQAIIADSDDDSIADANGLWLKGDKFEPITAQYSRSDTIDLTNPSLILINLVFAGSSIAVARSGYYGIEPEFNGAFTKRRKRYEWASELLKMANAALVIAEDGTRRIKQLNPAPIAELTTANVLYDSFSYDPVVDAEDYDGMLIKHPKSGDPQHTLYEHKVGLGNNESANPSDEVLELPFIEDSESAQKVGTAYAERTIDRKAGISCTSWGDAIRLNPEDVVRVSGDFYDAGTSYDAVVESVSITGDVLADLSLVQFGHDLTSFSDLSPSPYDIEDDDTNFYWSNIGMTNDQEALLNDLQDQADNKVSVFVQEGTPSWTDADSNHTDDCWYKPSERKWYKYDGSAWNEDDDSIYNIEQLADGKTTVHYGAIVPASSTGANGDLYIREDSDQVTYYKKISGSWVYMGLFEDGADGTQAHMHYITVSPRAGEAMYTTIEDAIAALTADWAGIYLKNGEYSPSSTITLPELDIDIIGESKGGVIINAPSSHLFSRDSASFDVKMQIQNITFVSVAMYLIRSIVYIYKVNSDYEIILQNCDFYLSDNNDLENPMGFKGVFCYEDTYNQKGSLCVSACRFFGGYTGVGAWGIEKAAAYNCTFNHQIRSHINFNGVNTQKINNCVIDGFRSSGISAEGPGGVTTSLQILGNTVRSSDDSLNTIGYQGIYAAFGGGNALIANNSILIDSDRENITDWRTAAIYASGSSTGKCTITGNDIYMDLFMLGSSNWSMSGILCYQCIDSRVVQNKVRLNNASTSYTNIGIRLEDTDASVITGNVVDMGYNNAANIAIDLKYDCSDNDGSDNITKNCGVSLDDNGTNNTVTTKDI